jgi:Ni,Fe-hydrogenase I cytochrome b subunit
MKDWIRHYLALDDERSPGRSWLYEVAIRNFWNGLFYNLRAYLRQRKAEHGT